MMFKRFYLKLKANYYLAKYVSAETPRKSRYFLNKFIECTYERNREIR